MDVLTAALFVVGLALLIVGGESLVRGASGFAASFGISPVVIGLTVVAFGTSSPELAVAIGSSLAGQPDLVVGNVVGSNIYNVLLVLGLAAAITSLTVDRQLVQRDVPLMVVASIAVFAMALDGVVGRFDGLILVVALAAWLGWSVWEGRRGSSGGPDAGPPVRGRPPKRRVSAVLVAVGLVLLVVGARWLVDGAVALATAIGLSSLVVGLTVVALGTSLPEIATSVIASLRGQRDLAVGNVVGSNLFNLLAVLGITALLVGDVPVAPGALTFDLPVMIGVAVACLPIFFTGHRVGRREGLLFLAYGAGYTIYLLATAVEHPRIVGYTEALAVFVVPLTVVTLVVVAARQYRERGLEPHG